MNRRTFLLNSASILFGGLLELNGLSRAYGFIEEIPKPSSPRISIIIDDIGFSRSLAKKFLDLQVPITFAILPKLEKSLALAEEIHAQGHEIMLHQPMEALDSSIDPGPGAVYVGYGAKRIAEVVRNNLAGIPHALGVNNHMGSRLTECREEINQVLNVIENNSLCFVDSLTSTRSVAYQEASRRHIPTAYRNIFLDNLRNEAHIINQLCTLANEAFKYGRAVGIGHPFPETARAIARFLSGPGNLSNYLVPISAILKT
jgi:uncharacterized protein